jgi:hypothetical protein
MKKTKTETLASAMDVLAREIQSGDGIANAAIAEAAERLRELNRTVVAALEWEHETSKAMCWPKPKWVEEYERMAAMPNVKSSATATGGGLALGMMMFKFHVSS